MGGTGSDREGELSVKWAVSYLNALLLCLLDVPQNDLYKVCNCITFWMI